MASAALRRCPYIVTFVPPRLRMQGDRNETWRAADEAVGGAGQQVEQPILIGRIDGEDVDGDHSGSLIFLDRRALMTTQRGVPRYLPPAAARIRSVIS
jgi:hypothetical protein